jgi:hypothetical protein
MEINLMRIKGSQNETLGLGRQRPVLQRINF